MRIQRTEMKMVVALLLALAMTGGAFAASVEDLMVGQQWPRDDDDFEDQTELSAAAGNLSLLGFGYTAFLPNGQKITSNLDDDAKDSIDWKAGGATTVGAYMLVHFPAGTSLTGFGAGSFSFEIASHDDNAVCAHRVLAGDGTDWYVSAAYPTYNSAGDRAYSVADVDWAKLGDTEAALMNGTDATALTDISGLLAGLSYSPLATLAPSLVLTKGGLYMDQDGDSDNDWRLGRLAWNDFAFLPTTREPDVSAATGGILLVNSPLPDAYVSGETPPTHIDQGLIDYLRSLSYTVWVADGQLEEGGSNKPTADLLDKFDLIIVSLNTNSGSYNGDTAVWNATTTPVILNSSYIARAVAGEDRWGWTTSANVTAGAVEETYALTIEAAATGHPLFDGLSSGFALADGTFFGDVIRGDESDIGAGTVLSLLQNPPTVDRDAAAVDPAQNRLGVVYWDAGQALGDGGNAGGPRLFVSMGAGNRNTPEVEGTYNLSADGEMFLANAVSWLISGEGAEGEGEGEGDPEGSGGPYTEGTPVAGMLGLGMIAAACALGGALVIRKK